MLAAALAALGVAGSRAATPPSPVGVNAEPVRIACVGDSITKRYGDDSYPAQLGRILGNAVTVVNFGHDNARVLKYSKPSYWDLPELDEVAAFEPDIVILMLGTNDAATDDDTRQAFADDYTAMIEHLEAFDSEPRVLLCTPPPLMPGYNDVRMVNLREEICPLIRQIGQDHGLFVIELQTHPDLQDPELYPDTVHPQAKGARLIAEQVRPHLTAPVPSGATPPRVLRRADNEAAKAALPDGRVVAVYLTTDDRGGTVELTGRDTTLHKPDDFKQWAAKVLVDSQGELQAVFRVYRNVNDGKRIAIDRFIDVWHARTYDGRSRWGRAQMIEQGWNGDIVGAMVELDNGRLLVPSQEWVPGGTLTPPHGPHHSLVLYSDDRGQTWQPCETRITAPVYEGYNGNNYGAIEASVIELKDGRLWMVMRTQTGFLYESRSDDQGTTWSEGQPSRFVSSTSPAFQLRLPDDRIALFWNNTQMPTRHEGNGVYGGRDALHAAISDDEGTTWRGFREVLLDPRRNDSPREDGDRGTAYPYAVAHNDGSIELTSGQGPPGWRSVLRVDPDWLLETRRSWKAADGLDDWSVFTSFGPSEDYWRDRTDGVKMLGDGSAMRLDRADECDADGAAWNFPAGDRGRLTLELRFNKGFRGAAISLNDRFFDPTDDRSEDLAVFTMSVAPDGTLPGGGSLALGEWVELTFAWNLGAGRCGVSVDGTRLAQLPLNERTVNGVSYLHLRSLAGDRSDSAGFDVRRVRAEVDP